MMTDLTVRWKVQAMDLSIRTFHLRSSNSDVQTLENEQIHLWWVRCESHASAYPWLHAQLSREEQCRADRFPMPGHRYRFVVAHSSLRIILGKYLSISPANIIMTQNQYGKPNLSNVYNSTIRFNMSHSSDITLLALTRNRDIGVDVESIVPIDTMDGIADGYFSRCETEDLAALPLSIARRRFYEYWTCKEALVKAMGHGLSFPFNAFDVMLEENQQQRFVSEHLGSEFQNWKLKILTAPDGYAAAMVISQNQFEMKN